MNTQVPPQFFMAQEVAATLLTLTATFRSDFKNPVLSQADHLLTSFPAECCCNHNALARLVLPSYKWFILTSGPFLLENTSRYRAGDFYWQQRTCILGQRKQLHAALTSGQHKWGCICAESSSAVCTFPITSHLTPKKPQSTRGSSGQPAVDCSGKTVCFNFFTQHWECRELGQSGKRNKVLFGNVKGKCTHYT